MAGSSHAAETETSVATNPGLAAPAIQPHVLEKQQAIHHIHIFPSRYEKNLPLQRDVKGFFFANDPPWVSLILG